MELNKCENGNNDRQHGLATQKISCSRKKWFFIAVLVLGFFFVISLCLDIVLRFTLNDKDQPQVASIKKPLSKLEVLKKNLNTSVNPCKDFYQFACGNHERADEHYLTTNSLDYNSILETFDILREDIAPDDISLFKSTKSYFRACLDAQLKEDDFDELLYVKNITKSANSVEAILARLHQNGLATFLEIHITPINTSLALQISKNSVVDKTRNELYEEFSLLSNDGTTFNVEGLLGTLVEITLLENDLNSKESADAEEVEDVQAISYESLVNGKDQAFDWNAFLTNLFPDNSNMTENRFVVKDENFITAMKTVLSGKSIGKARKVIEQFTANLMQSADSFEGLQLDDLFSGSWIKKSFAVEADYDRIGICMRKTHAIFGSAIIGLQYIEKHPNLRKILPEVEVLAENLVKQFKKNIEALDWLDRKSKKTVAQKVGDLKMAFAHLRKKKEDLFQFYDNIDLGDQTTSFKEKTTRIKSSLSKYHLKGLSRLELTEAIELNTSPATINAFNYQEQNTIYIPAFMVNYFDQPLTSMKYGLFGFIFAHEIGHTWDSTVINELNLYPYNLTTNSIRTFNQRAECFQDQFQVSEDDTIKNDGNATLSENIADSVGMKLALQAYQDFLKYNGIEIEPSKLIYTPDQLFFISFAQLFCSSNPFVTEGVHSYNKLRVIGILNNTMEFYDAFNCSIPEEHVVCKIW